MSGDRAGDGEADSDRDPDRRRDADPHRAGDSGPDGDEGRGGAATGGAADDDDGDWRFSLEDVGEGGAVAPPVEPGAPTAENVAFFLLGVAAAVGVILAIVV